MNTSRRISNRKPLVEANQVQSDPTQNPLSPDEGIEKPRVSIPVKQMTSHSGNFKESWEEKRSARLAHFAQDVSEEFSYNNPELDSTPCYPDEVIEQLPDLLRIGAEYFVTNKRERDVFLTGAIAILSGCFPTVSGVYRRRKMHPNLNVYIAAPAAGGKGAMVAASMLGEIIHKERLGMTQMILDDLKSKQKSKGSKGYVSFDEVPQYLLLAPGNSSSAAILKLLNDNDGCLIICETEADSLNNVFKTEFGNFSDIFRKSVHHEKISQSRKSSGYIEVLRPKISVILTGTPGQLVSFIPSTEDGLFSRFLYYIYSSTTKWDDPAPKDEDVSVEEYFEQIAHQTYDVHKSFINQEWKFKLQSNHWNILNQRYDHWLKTIQMYVSGDLESVILRLGLFQFRLAMVLSILRRFMHFSTDPTIICSDEDFIISDKMVDVLFTHAMNTYKLVPSKSNHRGVAENNSLKLLEILPQDRKFSREEAVYLGEGIGIKERTVDKYLHILRGMDCLYSDGNGTYIMIVQD